MKSWFVSISLFALACISLLTLSSIAPDLVIKQGSYFILAALLFYLVIKLPFVVLQKIANVGFFILFILLLALIIVGRQTRGITAWFTLFGGYKFQPSQFAIPTVLTTLTYYLHLNKSRTLLVFTKIVAIISLIGGLILIQPDMGTAAIYFVVCFIFISFVGFPTKYILSLISLMVIAIALSWPFVIKDFQKDRLTDYLSLLREEGTADYNSRQALIAVGSGQFVGRSLGHGVQSHLKFLPERQTDFIFASIAEEWGFIGSTVIIILYFGLSIFLIRSALKSQDGVNYALIVAISMMFFVQSGINIGMNVGLLPITGITLPMISYGGSSILAITITAAIAQNCLNRQKKKTVLTFS